MIENAKQRLQILIEQLREIYILPDPTAVRIILSGIVAHYFESDPLWIFLVAPPSSLKTELISGLDEVPEVYPLSSVTPQTLFSGLRKPRGQEKENSLLEKIGDKILTLKDFGTVLSMRREDRAIILGQLREVYDGKYHARYGNGVEVSWEGRIGLVAGCTPILDHHSSVFQTLGERFVIFRLNAVSEEKLTRSAIESLGDEHSNREKIKGLISQFMASLKIPPIREVKIPEQYRTCLGNLASLVVRARSGTVRDYYRKTLEYVPDPEAPARLVKQLATLCCALAVLEERKQVSLADYFVALKVGLDCIPRQRSLVLNYLSEDRQFKTTEVAEGVDYSTEGVRMHLEDLAAHGLVNIEKQGQGMADLWKLSGRTLKHMTGLIPEQDSKQFLQATSQRSLSYGKFLNHLLNVRQLEIEENNSKEHSVSGS